MDGCSLLLLHRACHSHSIFSLADTLDLRSFSTMATETIAKPVDTGSLTVSHASQEASQSEKFARTADQDVGFLSPPKLGFSNKFEEREYIKGKLACAYRVFGHYGLNEGLAGHITVRDPIEPETFWVNPFGVDFNRINKSDLLRVDHKGNILDHGKVKVLNKAAFLIHGTLSA